jgi:predicted RNA methylase
MRSKGIAYQLWPASTFLCQYIETNRITLFPSSISRPTSPLILELGSGCALVSMVVAALGCRVIATDLPEVVVHMNSNLELNRTYYSIVSMEDVLNTTSFGEDGESAWKGEIAVDSLAWGNEIDMERYAVAKYDMILVADCVYWEELFVPLLNTLIKLTTISPNTLILLSQTVRRQHIEKRFFKRLHAHFIVDMVSEEKKDGDRTRIYSVKRRLK